MKKFLVCFLSILVACSMVLCLNGCKEKKPPKKPAVEVGYLFLNAVGLKLDVSKTFDLEIVTDATDTSSLEFVSSNNNVATVSNDGVITAVSVGTATITAKLGDKSANCTISVFDSYPYPVIGLTVSNIRLDIGQTFNLNAKVIYRGNEVPASIEYSSENSNVASVSNDGVITAVSVGLVKITISAEHQGLPLLETVNVAVLSNSLLN